MSHDAYLSQDTQEKKFNSTHHTFDIQLAAKLKSVDLAILIHHFQYWINFNERLGKNFIDEKTWFYQTIQEMAAHFPYWSERQIDLMIKKLIKLGIIIKANHNKNKFIQTSWYAFAENVKSISPNGEMEITKRGNGDHQTVNCICKDTKKKILKKDSKEEEEAQAPPTISPSGKKFIPPKNTKERAPLVWTTDEDHEKLIKKYDGNEDFVKQCYLELSAWRNEKKRSEKDLGRDVVRSINSWVAEKVLKEQITENKFKNHMKNKTIPITYKNFIIDNIEFAKKVYEKYKDKGFTIYEKYLEYRESLNSTPKTYEFKEPGFIHALNFLLNQLGIQL